MAAKQLSILATCLLLLASVGIFCSANEIGHFIDYEESEDISISKLNRKLRDENMGDDEHSIASNVVKALASTIDKTELKAVAGKYSVYELLDMNTYWVNYMHYCSQAEVESRQSRCDELEEKDENKKLMRYCFYCASQYFETCRESIPAILSKRVLDKSRIPALTLRNIKQFVETFELWIRRDGYETESYAFNFNEFMKDPKSIPTSWNMIKKTCADVLEQMNDVLFFDSHPRLSVDYFRENLPDNEQDKALVGHCGTFLKVTDPKLSQHALLK